MATLYRQEKPVNGTWSQPVEVARLWNNELAPYPAASGADDERKYQTWAKDHATDILTPPFPQLAPAPFGNVPLNWQQAASLIVQPGAGANPNASKIPQPVTPTTPQRPTGGGNENRGHRVRMGGAGAGERPTADADRAAAYDTGRTRHKG